MSLLDRKLLRDLRALKSQALAVALVMACGRAMMIMTRSLILSLDTTREAYYSQNRFADVFARLKRAPNAVRDQLAAIPGVATVETGIALQVTLDVPGLDLPAVGLLNSIPERGEPVLNRVYLRAGRLPFSGTTRRELAAGEAFAEAHHLRPGDTLSAVLNGTKQTFHLSGIALSPEFVFEAPPGSALPDNKTYGVFWMPYKELATAFQLYGAFNSVALTLAPGASEGAVIAAADRLLAPYGGRGAYGRSNHPSHRRLDDEIRVLEGLSIAFPLVFLSVAAFMTNSVMSRQIALQREQIAMEQVERLGGVTEPEQRPAERRGQRQREHGLRTQRQARYIRHTPRADFLRQVLQVAVSEQGLPLFGVHGAAKIPRLATFPKHGKNQVRLSRACLEPGALSYS